uniref:Uncharacterized protein n=1 Tax=Rhizophora mucronata TaxID=61149 RepID=A0A2P2P7Q2_RHIMU
MFSVVKPNLAVVKDNRYFNR